jgi:hypothetical protein
MELIKPERYLCPKDISRVLCETYGLCVSADYIRVVRRASIQRGEYFFVAGLARPSDVLDFLRKNQRIGRRKIK